MPKKKSDAARHFEMMAEFFELMAANLYTEWKDMKFIKIVNGNAGHKSKAKFDEHKRFVYHSYKLALLRIELLKAVAKELDTGEKQDFDKIEPEGGLKRASRIITGNFKNLIP
jgi:hypothetical protein